MLYIAVIHSLSLLNGISLYEYFPIYLLPVMGIWVVSSFLLPVIMNAAVKALHRSFAAFGYM